MLEITFIYNSTLQLHLAAFDFEPQQSKVLVSPRRLSLRGLPGRGYHQNTAHSHSSTGSYCQQVGGLEVNPALFVVVLVCADIWISTPRWRGWVGPARATARLPRVLRPITGCRLSGHRCTKSCSRASNNKQLDRTGLMGKRDRTPPDLIPASELSLKVLSSH